MKSLNSFLQSHSNAWMVLPIHFLLVGLGLIAFHLLGHHEIFPLNFHLGNWDVGWYRKIVENGYVLNKGGQSSVAFFPLFPLLWKLTGLTKLGVSIVNLLIFNAALLLFWKTFKLKGAELLNVVAIPSLFFCFIPYSEALFFLGGMVAMCGFRKEIFWMVILGLLVCGFTRSVSVIFLPIIFGAYLLFSTKSNWKINLIQFLVLSALLYGANWLVHAYMVKVVGIEFTTFEIQKAWNKVFSFPIFPLTTWSGKRLVWLDGLALFTGFSAVLWVVGNALRKLKNFDFVPDKERIFSLSYLFLVSLITLFFSVQSDAGTSIYSLNRYVFATPFFSFFLLSIWRVDISWLRLLKIAGPLFLLVCIAFYRLPNIPEFGKAIIRSLEWIPYFIGMFAYAALFVLPKYWKNSLAPILLYSFNLFVGLWLFTEFLRGAWIG